MFDFSRQNGSTTPINGRSLGRWAQWQSATVESDIQYLVTYKILEVKKHLPQI